ncbi:hypothetical protein BZG36_02034 [Bifiguratus adelaidae]|uniref:Uncharacterized protein n=1 Tax=Bifiguratus adelaidae TaxID=1938954 RepID=A0A261Y291_9FUNG|nr:hypothetical protein BZG36_02034 [Bifiguratus adelaidae]
MVGFLFPIVDGWRSQAEPKSLSAGWVSVIRSMGGLCGVLYAATKLPSTTPTQLSLILALIAVAFWFLMDRTLGGFLLGIGVAAVGTLIVWLYNVGSDYGELMFSSGDLYGIQSWIPPILFSSSMCFGTIGRFAELSGRHAKL